MTNEVLSAKLAMIISFPTSTSGRTILFTISPKYNNDNDIDSYNDTDNDNDSNNDNAKHNNNDYTYNDSKPEEKMLKISMFLIAGVQRATIDLGGLLSTHETRVALGYRLVRLLRFFRA